MMRVYLDHNATSPLRPEAREAVLAALALPGNASAVHGEGRAARRVIEIAREQVGRLAGAEAKLVTFTSGGSEAAATLLSPGFKGRRANGAPARSLIVSAIEHSCVLAGGRFAPGDIHVCPVDAQGRIDLSALAGLLETVPGPALVAVMLANNETGVLQPLDAVGALVEAHGAGFVVDAVQALGKVPVDISAIGADAIFVSGHKIGAPQGVGAIIRGDETVEIDRLVLGGGQEARFRAGTENLAGIAGFGAAAAVVLDGISQEIARITALRDWMEADIATICRASQVIGLQANRLANTSLTVHPGLDGETTVIALDLAGIAVSTGSACASGKVAPSHVLAAMGIAADRAKSAIRVSLGWSTTQADVERFTAALAAHVQKLSDRASRAA
ncbi:cysteine desulfurase family protein [Phreatobacter stygius]|uniref:Cysteine desulfurase n=1 Tax=Phreatobacter stygius TaxID=1940610 RepID=A0A4D7BCL6_9HYPH|nr:cysteine desulfurase family protein [Phreatobacter stygius]QCI68580.1 cysteine desulfurase [Phreatobacter stygius]